MRERGRSAIYLLAGVYLLYLTYSMYSHIGDSTGTELIIMYIFLVLFALVGAGLVVFGIYLNYMYSKKSQNTKTEEANPSEKTKTLEGTKAAEETNTAEETKTAETTEENIE